MSVYLVETGNEFAKNIKLYIDHCAGLNALKVGVFKGERDDVNLEGVASGIAHREAYAVDGNAALVCAEVSVAGHVSIVCVLKGVDIAAVGIFKSGAYCCGIHMPLHYVTVKASVGWHGALYIDQVAHLQLANVGAEDRLTHSRHYVVAAAHISDGKAHSIVSQTLCHTELIGYVTAESDVKIVTYAIDGLYCGHSLNYTCKHDMLI